MFKLKFKNPFAKRVDEEKKDSENAVIPKNEQPVAETETTETEVAGATETTESAENSAVIVKEDPKELTEQTFAIEKASDSAVSKDKKSDKIKVKAEPTEFSRFAEILNKDESLIVEECKIFQIRNIMALLSKAVVRRGVSDGDMKTLVKNAFASGMGELAVSPAYLDGVVKTLKGEENIKVCAVVDFPFGESSFKLKISEIKNSVKRGVDAVMIVLNATVLKKDNAKEFRKEIRKISKVKGVERSVAINAEDVSAEEIKRLLKSAEKAGLDYATFLFGNVTEAELTDKMKDVNGGKGKIAVKVMANVENVSGVKTLIASGVDGIVTPFADDIAKELFKEFGIKSVKLA